MDIVVSNWAWIPLESFTPERLDRLRRRLTITPKRTSVHQQEILPIHLYRERRTDIGIPREFFFANRQLQHNVVDEMSRGRKVDVKFVGTLTADQKAAVVAATGVRGTSGIIQAAPGWGKTVVGLACWTELATTAMVVVQKEFLVHQWIERIHTFVPSARVGIVQQNNCQIGDDIDIAIAMIQSLEARKDEYPEELWKWAGLIISDECFVAGTKIRSDLGLLKIEDVQKGQVVQNAIGHGVVQRAMSKMVPVEDLRLLRFGDGHEEVCTKDHPFLGMTGWSPVSQLCDSDVLTRGGCFDVLKRHVGEVNASKHGDVRDLWTKEQCAHWKKILLQEMHGDSEEENADAAVPRVRQESKSSEVQVLFSEVCQRLEHEKSFQDGGVSDKALRDNEESACCGSDDGQECVREDEEEKSNAQEGDQGQGVSCVEKNGSSSSVSGRQWSASSGSAEDVARQLGKGLASGTCGEYGGQEGVLGNASAFQDRHCESRENGSDRSRWWEPSSNQCSEERQEEGTFSASTRLDSVAVLEQRDIERLGLCIEDGFVRVFNLSVSGHPSYVLSNDVVVHNCHRIAASTWSSVAPMFYAANRLGLSATPRRKDGADNVFFWHIGPILYKSKVKKVIPKLRRVFTKYEFRITPKFNPNDYSKEIQLRLLCGNPARNQLIVDELVKATTAGRKIIVLSERRKHLETLRELFGLVKPKGCICDFYVGDRSMDELKLAEKADVIFATFQMTKEALDIPRLDTAFLTTPVSDVEQAVGRIMREHPDKKIPVVVDFIDSEIKRFAKLWSSRLRFYKRAGMFVEEGEKAS